MAGFAYHVIKRNATNDSIFHMSDGMQGVYSKILNSSNIFKHVSLIFFLTFITIKDLERIKTQVDTFTAVQVSFFISKIT